ncbi:glucan biosynthesis protein D [Pseudomonas sp. PDM25]|jgi:glucans biosynthesis protein|uniref:glucan biosynthesis protein n=1 Tax=unclassified Pseudomonas TaxID=196821 RepID=UPI001C443232|nr:glucan biosynthesis protein D [Pseudomonas sp. PDM25]
MFTRRSFLTFASLSTAFCALNIKSAAIAEEHLKLGASEVFSFDSLIERARALVLKPYIAPATASAQLLSKIDYEAHGKIKFDPQHALFSKGSGQYPVTFFHLGTYFRVPVRLHLIKEGIAQEIIYDPSYFTMPAESPAHALPPDSGFSGFRLQESRRGDQKKRDWKHNDWVAFLGASYFRAIGELYQYGLSARGIALDVAQPDTAEEFPNFTHIWFETPKEDRNESVTLYALLDGPSICGAYRFTIHRTKGVVMDVECALFLRQDVGRFGIAPLTSMHWFSETAKRTAADWRPEVHDSDGLALWTGNGERIWRPLNNPGRTMASAFSDNHPRGFGLLQRDRDFNNFEDGVHYERRPSLWVEPLGDWGAGSVQLVEIPTDDEIHDNIVAMWVPAEPAEAGNTYRLRYRLHWLADEPYPSELARCVATRLGNGGQPGQPRPKGVRKFVVEFKGTPLEKLAFGVKPQAVLSSSRGTFSNVFTEAVPDGVPGHWRAQFDLSVDGKDPVELRLFLLLDGKTLSETWLYQYHPFDSQSGAIALQHPSETFNVS